MEQSSKYKKQKQKNKGNYNMITTTQRTS